MDGPISSNGSNRRTSVEWAAREPGSSPTASRASLAASRATHPSIPEETAVDGDIEQPAQSDLNPASLLSRTSVLKDDSAVVHESPDPLTPGEDRVLHQLGGVRPNITLDTSGRQRHAAASTSNALKDAKEEEGPPPLKFRGISAPAELGEKHKRLSKSTTISAPETSDDRLMFRRVDSISVPIMHQAASLPMEETNPIEEAVNPEPRVDEQVEGRPTAPSAAVGKGREEGWGVAFKIKWIKTDPLPFQRTRHLRNPWNSDVSNSR